MRRPLNALVVVLMGACAPQAGDAETHIVEIRGLEFIPAEIAVARGDVVTWVNADVMPHTATAADGSWDSGTMEPGDEWSLVIETEGAFDYVCAFHPTMTGVINAR